MLVNHVLHSYVPHPSLFLHPQAEWREEVKLHFEKIKSEGTCLHRLEEELVMRRREELRCVPVWKGDFSNSRDRGPVLMDWDQLWQPGRPANLRDPSAHCRHALDIREHYERKLERANNLYMELNALMLQLELKERELLR